jgi:ubiquinone/menaquinone biosynthesis C-methylase UbiE
VKRKIVREGLTNVEVKLADACETGLPVERVDVAFLFSVIHAFKNLNELLAEMHRVLKMHGILSIQSRLPVEKMVKTVTANCSISERNKTGPRIRKRETNNS